MTRALASLLALCLLSGASGAMLHRLYEPCRVHAISLCALAQIARR